MKIIKPYIDLMFTKSDEKVLISLYGQAINMYKDSNSSVMILIKLMEKKNHWDLYLIDLVKGTFGLRWSSYSEFNRSSVIFFVIKQTEGMYGAISELMKRQRILMLKNHNIICHEFLQLKVIHQSHSP